MRKSESTDNVIDYHECHSTVLTNALLLE